MRDGIPQKRGELRLMGERDVWFYTLTMLWFLGAVPAAILIFLLFNRPLRQWRAKVLAAMHARKRSDWGAAAKFYQEAPQRPGN